MTIIIDEIGSTVVNVNEFKCGYEGNNNITMIVSSFGQNRVETEIFRVFIYDMYQVSIESLLIIVVSIIFDTFVYAT